MRTHHTLLRNQCHGATIVPARMRANGNFSDASLEWLRSVSVTIIVGWVQVMLLTWSCSWCVCLCFSGIRQVALRCNRLLFEILCPP